MMSTCAINECEAEMDEVPENVDDIAYDWQAMNAITEALDLGDADEAVRRLEDIAGHIEPWLQPDEERRAWLRMIEAVQRLVYATGDQRR